jgi:hypothetical protein
VRRAVMGDQGKPGTLTWDYNIPLVSNLLVLKDFLLVIVLSLAALQLVLLLVGFFSGEGYVVLPPKLYAIVAAVLAGLFLVAAGVVLQNRFRATFSVGPHGISYVSGPRERRINRVVFALSMFVGRPGASLLALSEESGRFSWVDVHKVTVHRRQRVITLSNSWRPLVRLYCPPETFGEILSLVQAHIAAVAVSRAKRPRALPRPWWAYALWTAGVIVATFLGVAHYETQFDDVWRLLVLAAVLVLCAGILQAPVTRRLFALGGAGLGIYVLVELLVEAVQPITGLSGMVFGRSYEVDTPLLVLSIVGQLALIAMAGWRLLGRGRRPKLRRGR